MRISTFVLLAGFATMSAAPAFADEPDWTACKKEIDLWCADAKGDEATYTCLYKHDSALSKKCDEKAVTPYEKKTGKAG